MFAKSAAANKKLQVSFGHRVKKQAPSQNSSAAEATTSADTSADSGLNFDGGLPRSTALQNARHTKSSVDKRSFQRVPVRLTGRLATSDKTEHECTTIDMSANGVAVETEARPKVESPVIIYINSIGRLSGTVVRPLDNGFAATFTATDARKDELASLLTYLCNVEALGLSEQRGQERYKPLQSDCLIKMGRKKLIGTLSDFSLSGAGIEVDMPLSVGDKVYLGKVAAEVIRHTERGYGVSFEKTYLLPKHLQSLLPYNDVQGSSYSR